jgi:hypothetical protein
MNRHGADGAPPATVFNFKLYKFRFYAKADGLLIFMPNKLNKKARMSLMAAGVNEINY